MNTRKSMKLPIVITFIMLIIVVYLFATLQQDKVVCEKTTNFDNDVTLKEVVTTTIDNDSISNIQLVKKIILPKKGVRKVFETPSGYFDIKINERMIIK